MGVCKLEETLLIVDDDECIRETLSECLEAEGYVVHTACNGVEALAVLDELKDHPCLILCDLRMPLMTGAEFAKHLKSDQQRKSIPVVILSAAQNEGQAKEADQFIKKPFNLDEVLAAIRAYCEAESEKKNLRTG